jgi:phospholipase/carboxylesterase
VPLDETAMVWSAPLQRRSERPLLVLLHGHGGVEQDLVDIFPMLGDEVVAVALRGPVPVGQRWAWADFTAPQPEQLQAVARAILAWLDRVPRPPSVGLLGFSQGAAMAIQLLRSDPGRFSYLVSLSGLMRPGAPAGDDDVASARIPALFLHGRADDVIADDEVRRIHRWLGRHTALTDRWYDDLGHEVNDAVLSDAARFVVDPVRLP